MIPRNNGGGNVDCTHCGRSIPVPKTVGKGDEFVCDGCGVVNYVVFGRSAHSQGIDLVCFEDCKDKSCPECSKPGTVSL
jgi:hypothetical protein